jgi:hypothetical protein
MKHFAAILIVTGLLGCGTEHHEAHDHEGAEAETHALYQKDRGLLLPAELRESLGVTFVEIAELPVTVPKGAVVEGVQEDFVYVQNGEHLARTPVVTSRARGIKSRSTRAS